MQISPRIVTAHLHLWATLLMTFLHMSCVRGNPITDYTSNPGRWTWPCGGSSTTPSANPTFPSVPLPPKDHLDTIPANLCEAETRSKLLKLELGSNRIEGNRTVNWLETISHPGVPTEDNSEISDSNLTDTLLRDYQSMSILAAFIEKAKWDEVKYAGGDGYFPDYKALESSHYNVMCSLQNAILSANATIDEYVSRDVVTFYVSIQEPNKANRNMQAYVTVKDAEKFYSGMSTKYTNYVS